jgi:hypothetical protein
MAPRPHPGTRQGTEGECHGAVCSGFSHNLRLLPVGPCVQGTACVSQKLWSPGLFLWSLQCTMGARHSGTVWMRAPQFSWPQAPNQALGPDLVACPFPGLMDIKPATVCSWIPSVQDHIGPNGSTWPFLMNSGGLGQDDPACLPGVQTAGGNCSLRLGLQDQFLRKPGSIPSLLPTELGNGDVHHSHGRLSMHWAVASPGPVTPS